MTTHRLDQQLHRLFGLVPDIVWARPTHENWAPRLNDEHSIAPGISDEAVARAWSEQFGPQRYDFTDGMPWCSYCFRFRWHADQELHPISDRYWLCRPCYDSNKQVTHGKVPFPNTFRWKTEKVGMLPKVCICGDTNCIAAPNKVEEGA